MSPSSRILSVVSASLALLLFWVLLREHYPAKFLNFINGQGEKKDTLSFRDNFEFGEQTGLFREYRAQRKIVMMGTSLTFRAHWNELLNRCDVANRGVGNDLSAGFLDRLDFTLNVQPRICFIEGGINDITRGIAAETVIRNLDTLLNRLAAGNVRPVLMAVPLVAENFRNAAWVNERIRNLNQQLSELADRRGVRLLNLNPVIGDEKFRKKEFVMEDGIHFNGSAYAVWRDSVLSILGEIEK